MSIRRARCLTWVVPVCLLIFEILGREVPAEEVSAAPVWQPLLARLAAEGQDKKGLENLFSTLPGTINGAPMGTKITELYRNKFVYKTSDGTPPKPRPRYYPGTLTAKNAAICRKFLAENSAAFDRVEKVTGVPKNIACALLFVETRLGTNVGNTSALYILASMALSTTPETILPWLKKIDNYPEHLVWIEPAMAKRAEWAYTELRALTDYALSQNLDPRTMPGSIYGAIGMCQFMPSNIKAYGADGDGDGCIDLFHPADAIASLSTYLQKHGWKPDSDTAAQHAILKKYNKSDTYANTIQALAAIIDDATALAHIP